MQKPVILLLYLINMDVSNKYIFCGSVNIHIKGSLPPPPPSLNDDGRFALDFCRESGFINL